MTRLGARAADAMFWNLLGKFALMLLRFLESVILVRLLGDAGYGAFSQATNLNAIVVLLAALGLENALLRFLPETVVQLGEGGERRLVHKTLLLRLAASLLAAAVLWQLAEPLAQRLLHDAARADLVKITAALVIAMGFDNLMARVLVARYEQRFINLIQAALTGAYLAGAALAIWLGGGIAQVLLCVVAMHGATAALFFWRWRRPNALAAAPTGGETAITVGRLLSFSGYTYVYNFLQFVFQKGMDVLLLGLLLPDLAPVAWYVIAYNFVFYSVSFFSNAFSEGFSLAMVSEVAARRDMEKLRRIFAVSMEYLYLFVIPIFIGGLIVGADILRLLYPATSARGAAAPMYVLLFGLSFSKMGAVTANFLLGLDREKTLVRLRLLFGALNFLLDLALIPWLGPLGAAIATTIAVTGGVAAEWRVAHQLVQPTYPWRFLAKTLLAGLGMGAALLWLRGPAPAALHWRVPLLLLAGTGVFVVLLALLRPFRREHAALLETLPLPWLKRWLPLLVERDSAGEPRP
jgi:O-antigen/teichoic acid export membrane protein